MQKVKAWVSLLRIKQYTKNFFVLSPLFFSFSFLNKEAVLISLPGFILFCSSASSVYIFNDILDRKEDAAHPVKCTRPIAAGTIKITTAAITGTLLLILSIGFSFLLNTQFAWMIVTYFVINFLYSLALKKIAVVDLLIISLGFVLRIYAGGLLIQVLPSTWLALMTFLISLILALGKRRDDVLLSVNGSQTISTAKGYNIEMLNNSIVAIAGVVLVCYIQYTLSPEIQAHFHNRYLYANVVFVIAGFLRYFQILFVEKGSSNPSEIIFQDKFLLATIILWLSSFVLFIK